MGAILKFLQAARNLAKQGVKRDEILAFAKREFGEVTDYMKNAVDDIYSRYAASPLKKVLDRRKTGKQSIDERKVLDMEGKVIDPNQPILGGKQTKMEAPSLEFNVEKFIEDFPVSREEAVRISKLPRAERKVILQKYIDNDFKQQIELMDFEPPKDRDPNAYGGIAGTLRLNREGYVTGKLVKGYQAGKAFWKLLKDPKKIRAAVDDIFPTGDYKMDAEMAVESLVELNPKVFGGKLADDLDDALRSEIYGAVIGPIQQNALKVSRMKKATKPTKTLEGIEKTGTINISDPNVADEFSRFMKETDPKGFKDIEQKVELSNLDIKGKKGHAEGGRVSMVKGGLPNILKL